MTPAGAPQSPETEAKTGATPASASDSPVAGSSPSTSTETRTPPPDQAQPTPPNPEPPRGFSGNYGTFGKVSNSTITFLQNEYFNQLETLKMFSARDYEEVSPGDEIGTAGYFVYDADFVDECLKVLDIRRMVLLIGEPETGKASLSRYLAGRLRERGKLEQNTLLVSPPLSSDVKIPLPSALRDNDLRSRVVIFPDILERGNTTVREFVMRLRGDAASHVGKELERSNSYLIITSAVGSLPPDCLNGLPSWLRPTIPALTTEQVLLGVQQHIGRLIEQGLAPRMKAITDEIKLEIATRARTVSRAVRFIESSLSAVLDGTTSVQRAFDALDATVTWFQNSADTDREAWIYMLALVVAHTLGRGEDIPWTEFSCFYEEIRSHLLRERKPDETQRSFDEARLRRLAGAVIVRDRIRVRDVIAFKDVGMAGRLWDVLLSDFRSTALSLIPLLQDLTAHKKVNIRARAAQSLGRIGWLDAAMIKQWVFDWSKGEAPEKALAGYAVLGAFSIGDRTYRDFVLELLDSLSKNPARVWTAMTAYKQIGQIDLPLALDKLRGIAKLHLAPVFEESRDVHSSLEGLDRKLSEIRTVEAELMRDILGSFEAFYADSLKDKEEIAEALKFTLVSMSMTVGLAPVLAAMSRWAIASDGMGAVVCFVFLMEGGIVTEMTKKHIGVVLRSGDGIKAISCNFVLASLIDDSQAVQTVARFLETMCAVLLQFFPPDATTSLVHVLFDHLQRWVRESLSVPECRTAMVELVGRLLKSNLGELYERTFDWLSASSDFASGDMAAFANDARTFSLRIG